jgi:FHS family L-fucose permease-like MFS transporter
MHPTLPSLPPGAFGLTEPKELFTLSHTEAMLVQFCFFTAYAVIGVPGAMLVRKVGYMRGAS